MKITKKQLRNIISQELSVNKHKINEDNEFMTDTKRLASNHPTKHVSFIDLPVYSDENRRKVAEKLINDNDLMVSVDELLNHGFELFVDVGEGGENYNLVGTVPKEKYEHLDTRTSDRP